MKNLLTAVSFCLLMIACKKTEIITETVTVRDTLTRTINLDSGLIAFYPFNGNANDESGNNKNGVLVNGTGFSTDAKNNANKAANFDGVNDYIQIADQNSSFAQDKMTVSFQFNLRNATVRNSFLCKTNFTTPSGVSWIASLPGGVPYVDFKASVPAACSVVFTNDSYSVTTSNIPIQNNRWYHVTMIYNYGLQIIYINGVYNSATVSNYSSLKKCNTSDLFVGGWWKDDIISLNGKFDELRIYNRILGENEIEKLAIEVN